MFGNLDERSQRLFQRFVEKPADHGLLPRHKRNVFLSSGLRLCSQETVQQAVSNHLKYYQLRGETLVLILVIRLVLIVIALYNLCIVLLVHTLMYYIFIQNSVPRTESSFLYTSFLEHSKIKSTSIS